MAIATMYSIYNIALVFHSLSRSKDNNPYLKDMNFHYKILINIDITGIF